MTKILCLIDSLGPGGAQRQLVGLANLLKNSGFDVLVAFYHKEFFYADSLKRNGVQYLHIKRANNKTLRLFYIAKFILKTKPKIVISYLAVPSICACIIRLFIHSYKLIVSERSLDQHNGIKESFRFNCYRIASFIVPNSFSQSSYIRQNFPFLSKKLITIPNFVDLKSFYPIYHKRHFCKEILVVASIEPCKNTLGFIDAVASLSQRQTSFHISWYGIDGSNKDYLKSCLEKIKEKNLSPYLSLLEKTSAIQERYREADYFCLPSFYEGVPNVICEAMASGLPIVCSDVSDNSIYVINGKNGFLFNPLDINSIASSLNKILNLSEDDYHSFGVASRSIAEEKFSPDSFIKSYLNLL